VSPSFAPSAFAMCTSRSTRKVGLLPLLEGEHGGEAAGLHVTAQASAASGAKSGFSLGKPANALEVAAGAECPRVAVGVEGGEGALAEVSTGGATADAAEGAQEGHVGELGKEREWAGRRASYDCAR